jgi:hypothetical protein
VYARRRSWDLSEDHLWTVSNDAVLAQRPALVAPVSGGCIVAWTAPAGAAYRVRLQRFAGDDTGLGPVLDLGTTSQSTRASLAATWDGRFLAAWGNRTVAPLGVHVRAWDADGTPLGPTVRLDPTSGPGPASGPGLALWPFATNAAAAWAQEGVDGDGTGVLLHRLADDATPIYH